MKVSRQIRLGAARGAVAMILVLATQQAPVRSATPENVLSYGAQCAALITSIQPFDCRDGEIIPITRNGKPVTDQSPPDCDRPTQLLAPEVKWPEGRCVPFSRVLLLADGPTQVTALCRRKRFRSESDPRFEEVDVVAHSVRTGATCWFAAHRDDDEPFEASRVPPPDEVTPPVGKVAAASFWNGPVKVAHEDCAGCHDNSPYMFSPFMGQVWHKVPTDPFGRYENIGAAFTRSGPMESVDPPDNTCTGCHRIGTTSSCKIDFLTKIGAIPPHISADGANGPAQYWMPLIHGLSQEAWQKLNSSSIAALQRCCADPKRHECYVKPIPGQNAQ
jgi:hypothetical protein